MKSYQKYLYLYAILSVFVICLGTFARAFGEHESGGDSIQTAGWVIFVIITVLITIEAIRDFND